jgi:hypothetical protein
VKIFNDLNLCLRIQVLVQFNLDPPVHKCLILAIQSRENGVGFVSIKGQMTDHGGQHVRPLMMEYPVDRSRC